MSSPSSIASSSNGHLDRSLPARLSSPVRPPPEVRRRHSTSPQRGRYEHARRPSDPERPRNRDYSPVRREYRPREREELPRGRDDLPRSGGEYYQESRSRDAPSDLRLDTQITNRTRDEPASSAQSDRGRRSPITPYSSASTNRRQNHAQRRTAKWKAGGNKKGYYNNNNQQNRHQYQTRKTWNRSRKPSDDTQSPTSPSVPRSRSPIENSPDYDQYTNRMCYSHGLGSPMLNHSAVSFTDLDHAKDLVLDLLGWGVPPQYLLDRGVSPQLVHRIFTDLQLQLPENFALPSDLAEAPSSVVSKVTF
ncbi:hypothetical protein NMY22_g17991 [Coprinellus aureogranulatus]|nr:hypothetical protein NMY22_g17991 [Coprinellus aureogranulatus]